MNLEQALTARVARRETPIADDRVALAQERAALAKRLAAMKRLYETHPRDSDPERIQSAEDRVAEIDAMLTEAARPLSRREEIMAAIQYGTRVDHARRTGQPVALNDDAALSAIALGGRVAARRSDLRSDIAAAIKADATNTN